VVLQSDYEKSFAEKIKFAEKLAAAVVERERLRERLLRWMRATPLILAPASATVAFIHGAARINVKGRSISIFRSCAYSHAANVFGLPAAVVPVTRTTAGLPIGVQLIGRPAEEWRVLAAAAAIERQAEFE
jgi:amidase